MSLTRSERRNDPEGIERRLAAILVILLGLTQPAVALAAGPGPVQIDHVCAVGAGCFAGDAPGYPVTIDGSAGLSYRLTSNLIVPNANTDGIVLSVSSVSIDLNGFEIVRAGCEQAIFDCTPTSGNGSGIERTTSLLRGLSVRNGSITGMGANGLVLGIQARVENVRVRWNRTDGINVDDGSVVTNCLAYQNGDDGISADQGSTISWNVSVRNDDDGIFASFGSLVKGNVSYDNGDDGVNLGFGAAVQSNASTWNDGYGLFLGDAGYRENVLGSNGDGGVLGGLNLGSNRCGIVPCP